MRSWTIAINLNLGRRCIAAAAASSSSSKSCILHRGPWPRETVSGRRGASRTCPPGTHRCRCSPAISTRDAGPVRPEDTRIRRRIRMWSRTWTWTCFITVCGRRALHHCMGVYCRDTTCVCVCAYVRMHMYWYFHIVSGSGRAKRQVCMVRACGPGQTHNVESRMRRLILTTAQDAGSPWVERKHGARSTEHETLTLTRAARACTCDGHDLPCEAGGCIRDADDAAGPLTLTLAGSGWRARPR